MKVKKVKGFPKEKKYPKQMSAKILGGGYFAGGYNHARDEIGNLDIPLSGKKIDRVKKEFLMTRKEYLHTRTERTNMEWAAVLNNRLNNLAQAIKEAFAKGELLEGKR